jgi:hypothetical protein
MALVNPSIITVLNTAAQPLYGIDFPFTGVPRYISTGSAATLVFNTTATSTTATDITANLAKGEITLKPNVVFQITAHANLVSGNVTGSYKIVNTATNATVGFAVPIGQPLNITTSSATTATYKIVAYTTLGQDWSYPAQIANTNVMVQAISGYNQ